MNRKEMERSELHWDKLLSVRTMGRDDSNADQFRYPYEPTPYCVLERLASSGLIRKGDVLLDYGCGKGRVDFFLSYQTRCHSIGIEYDERIYRTAEENRMGSPAGRRVSFEPVNAVEYELPPQVNRIYYFNPFSVEILRKVLARVTESWYREPREILLFFYYPSDEYVAELMTAEELEFFDEIDCRDLFEGNDSRERIILFRMGTDDPMGTDET